MVVASSLFSNNAANPHQQEGLKSKTNHFKVSFPKPNCFLARHGVCVVFVHLISIFQIDNLSTSLESTNDKLKTMEEVSEEYRYQDSLIPDEFK